jgi:hypothetical protein
MSSAESNWRIAQMRYPVHRIEPNLAAYRKALKVFADLVVRAEDS